MDETKLLLGKILGEIYRLQKANGINSGVGAERIYGLINGFEHCITDELESMGFISKERFDLVSSVLCEYSNDEKKLKEFKGFYDIEKTLQDKGVNRGQARQIIKYFKACDQFTNIINKMNSQYSPVECTTFDLYEYEK